MMSQEVDLLLCSSHQPEPAALHPTVVRVKTQSNWSYFHNLHLQVFMERRRDSDGLQHLAEQLFLQRLHLHAGTAHKPVLTQEFLKHTGSVKLDVLTLRNPKK